MFCMRNGQRIVALWHLPNFTKKMKEKNPHKKTAVTGDKLHLKTRVRGMWPILIPSHPTFRKRLHNVGGAVKTLFGHARFRWGGWLTWNKRENERVRFGRLGKYGGNSHRGSGGDHIFPFTNIRGKIKAGNKKKLTKISKKANMNSQKLLREIRPCKQFLSKINSLTSSEKNESTSTKNRQ